MQEDLGVQSQPLIYNRLGYTVRPHLKQRLWVHTHKGASLGCQKLASFRQVCLASRLSTLSSRVDRSPGGMSLENNCREHWDGP